MTNRTCLLKEKTVGSVVLVLAGRVQAKNFASGHGQPPGIKPPTRRIPDLPSDKLGEEQRAYE